MGVTRLYTHFHHSLHDACLSQSQHVSNVTQYIHVPGPTYIVYVHIRKS